MITIIRKDGSEKCYVLPERHLEGVRLKHRRRYDGIKDY